MDEYELSSVDAVTMRTADIARAWYSIATP
jgi:hypothetical protein